MREQEKIAFDLPTFLSVRGVSAFFLICVHISPRHNQHVETQHIISATQCVLTLALTYSVLTLPSTLVLHRDFIL